MKNEKKFRDDLIELLYDYDLSVANFLKKVNNNWFWVDKTSNKKLIKLIKEGVEV